ncbi:acyl-CoA carboxylase subunit epsilon [Demequina oxidasica]|uniref:acyl-CoA carboxylase subunit epsilon n=1 Tax=Demequina oxidasica TaxID=676199 RepID=UPI000AE66136|nr:acyl-CoA carboxylase subunit epsilon [Demequina oxidasica]
MTPDATDHHQDAAASTAGMRVVRGTPDDAELAALVAGMAAFASTADAGDDEPGSPTSAWMDRARSMRGSRSHGPLGRGASAWRHSLR